MKVNEALKITDSFTRTSKMPGLSYSLPAWACKTGQKLAKIPGTPCYGCYAMKGNYTRYPAIKRAQYRRLEAIKHPDWVTAMVAVIKRQKWFRWHDAGDVQSPEHMQKIYIGHLRWLQDQGPSYKQQAASCKRQAASLTRDLYCVIGYSRRKKYESK